MAERLKLSRVGPHELSNRCQLSGACGMGVECGRLSLNR